MAIRCPPSPAGVPTPCAHFDLFAQANGVGTVWNGLAKRAINDLLPETRTSPGIPDDQLIGYVMAFGRPAVRYARTVQHGPALIHRVLHSKENSDESCHTVS